MAKATYIGSQYMNWDIDGKKGEKTEVHLLMPFLRGAKDCVGDRVRMEKVDYDMREELQDFTPGQLVDVDYVPNNKGVSVFVGISEA